MNRINVRVFSIVIFIVIASLFSCGKSEKESDLGSIDVGLIVEPKIIDASETGGDYTVEIKNGDIIKWDYEIENNPEWIVIKRQSPLQIVFNISKNEGEKRSCKIIIKNKNNNEDFVWITINQQEKVTEEFDPISMGYTLQSSMQGDPSLLGKNYVEIHNYMKQYGWDYSEHPNSSDLDHNDGIHCLNIYDETLKQYVFKFMIHVNPILDGDRGEFIDRQRNEMKSQTSGSWYKMNGNWDEWQILEWKFNIPKGFRPSTSFCHIHQLKAQEGNNSMPIITITLRGNNDGTNRRVQVIHTGDISATNKGTIVDNIPLEEFEDEWVQVQEEVHYTHNGFFRIKITRISDNKVLMDYSIDNIDMWRKGATNIRNKFGIYRSYGKTLSDPNDRPSNGIKDESLLLGDFYIYEKNTNPNPQPHE